MLETPLKKNVTNEFIFGQILNWAAINLWTTILGLQSHIYELLQYYEAWTPTRTPDMTRTRQHR